MAITSIAIGSPAEAGQPDALKAALAEFISMLIFVFAGEGSGMAFGKNLASLSIHAEPMKAYREKNILYWIFIILHYG